MAHLIDKDAVLAIIEQLKDEAIDMEDKARWFLSAALTRKIEALKVKEVDLEKEKMNECPFKKIGCEMYEGHILECKGECSWVIDHPKLKELKAQEGKKL